MTHYVSHSRRLRATPFTPGVEAAGVKAYTVYNRMLLPTVFEDVEYDYHHLKQHVQVWDVSVERQVELAGPDAARLMQMLTPRDLGRMQEDQCYYVPIINEAGGMLNDPVAIKHDADRWWISIADSDLRLWVRGLAVGAGLDVQVFEPDVSPLAVQGPKADALMERVFGEAVHNIRFFRQKRLGFGGTSFIVARSGYSKQGGFEIYVEGAEHGMPLWEALFEAGADLNVRPGCPNLIERIEGGLLSYGNDMTEANTPLECGLGKFCTGAGKVDHVGRAALARELEIGPKQKIRPLSIADAALLPARTAWPLFDGARQVGQVTSCAWSPDFQTNVAIGMVSAACDATGASLTVITPEGRRAARIEPHFWC
ncbi:MAG: dimethylsulfoniopropionate demethylase [Silicimonas sp.]|nr:dimethylsulfoniopropionate demethylase [Silicimonas sp.]